MCKIRYRKKKEAGIGEWDSRVEVWLLSRKLGVLTLIYQGYMWEIIEREIENVCGENNKLID